MRAQSQERGVIESGFQRAEDGWHVVKFLEGIDYLKKKEGGEEKISINKQGDKNWKFPMVVDDEEDISHEVEIDAIYAENAKGEQMVMNFLGATGLSAKFSKAFPGDISVFDDKVMVKIKPTLPGQYMRIKTKQNTYKDKSGQEQTAVNLIGFGKMSDAVEALEAELFPEKKGAAAGKGAGKGGTATKTKVVEEDDPF